MLLLIALVKDMHQLLQTTADAGTTSLTHLFVAAAGVQQSAECSIDMVAKIINAVYAVIESPYQCQHLHHVASTAGSGGGLLALFGLFMMFDYNNDFLLNVLLTGLACVARVYSLVAQYGGKPGWPEVQPHDHLMRFGCIKVAAASFTFAFEVLHDPPHSKL